MTFGHVVSVAAHQGILTVGPRPFVGFVRVASKSIPSRGLVGDIVRWT
jgi:hypothetical protein